MQYFFIYLAIINALGFLLMLIDKQKAKRKKWRISEATLIWTAALGGSVGSLCGMHIFRHKTLHKKFTLGIPAILIGQLLLAGVIIYFMLQKNTGC